MSEIQRPALRYRGGKWRIASWIIRHLPVHECYVEPFMGACSVLLQKPPSAFEVVNDLDGYVVAFFRCLRDRRADLEESIWLTPCSRQELRLAYEPAEDELEKARKLYMRCAIGRGSANRKSGWRFQKAWNGWGKDYPRLMKHLDHFGPIADRLMTVQIEQDDALATIRRFDGPRTVFYVDPPYMAEFRARSRDLYSTELNDEDHLRLAEVLHSIVGMALVSGYASPLYEKIYAGWRQVKKIAYGERQKQVTECLWISPAAEQALSNSQIEMPVH